MTEMTNFHVTVLVESQENDNNCRSLEGKIIKSHHGPLFRKQLPPLAQRMQVDGITTYLLLQFSKFSRCKWLIQVHIPICDRSLLCLRWVFCWESLPFEFRPTCTAFIWLNSTQYMALHMDYKYDSILV